MSVRSMVYDPVAATWSIEMPYPFQLLGYSEFDSLPSGATINYPNSKITFPAPVLQQGYSETWQALFISLMYANANYGRYPLAPALPQTTYEGLYKQYFFSYLNNQLSANNYNTFLMPGSEIIEFWLAESSNPDTSFQYMNHLRSLTENIFKQSDRAMWGAPGVYTIKDLSNEIYYPKYRLETPNSYNAGFTGITSRKVANWQTIQSLPGPLSTAKNVYVWIYIWDGVSESTVVWGSETVPYNSAPLVFSGANDGLDIRNVYNTILTGSGDMNQLITDIISGTTGYSSDNPPGFSASTYWYGMSNDWSGGTYTFPAIPPDQNFGIGIAVDYDSVAQEPYWQGFSAFMSGSGGNMNLLTLEYKPTE